MKALREQCDTNGILSKQMVQKSQYAQAAMLHRGPRYISQKSDPEFAVPFSIPQQEVIELFQRIAKNMSFQMIQSEQNYATAVKKPPKTGIFQFLNCLTWWGAGHRINAIKLTILSSPKSSDPALKLCRVRALCQSSPQVVAFIEAFKDKMQRIKGVVPSTYLFQPSSYTEQSIYQSNSNPFHLQACAFYMFHKILTSTNGPQHEIKESIQKSLRQFFQAFKNTQQSSSLLPTPLNNIIDIAEQTCIQITKLLTVKGRSNSESEAIIPYMKISVQKYLFDRTQSTLQNMYQNRDKQIVQKFNKKKKKIIQTMKKQEIFEQVLLNKNLRALQMAQNPRDRVRGGIQFCRIACPELEKIKQASSLRQKIKYCQLMYAQLKSYFYQKLKMKYQLSSMEDIIPVFIIIILFTQVQYLRSQLNMMIDFIHAANQDFQPQKRLLINLSESYNYVVRDWKIQTQ